MGRKAEPKCLYCARSYATEEEAIAMVNYFVFIYVLDRLFGGGSERLHAYLLIA